MHGRAAAETARVVRARCLTVSARRWAATQRSAAAHEPASALRASAAYSSNSTSCVS